MLVHGINFARIDHSLEQLLLQTKKKTYLEEDINDEYVENVFEWDDNTIKDSLEFGHSVDGLQRSQDPEQLQAL